VLPAWSYGAPGLCNHCVRRALARERTMIGKTNSAAPMRPWGGPGRSSMSRPAASPGGCFWRSAVSMCPRIPRSANRLPVTVRATSGQNLGRSSIGQVSLTCFRISSNSHQCAAGRRQEPPLQRGGDHRGPGTETDSQCVKPRVQILPASPAHADVRAPGAVLSHRRGFIRLGLDPADRQAGLAVAP
jgi:hypothetical protein